MRCCNVRECPGLEHLGLGAGHGGPSDTGINPSGLGKGLGADVRYSGHCNAGGYFFLEEKARGSESGVVPTRFIASDCLPISLYAAAGLVNPAKGFTVEPTRPRLLFLSAGPSASLIFLVDNTVAQNNGKCQDHKICPSVPSC